MSGIDVCDNGDIRLSNSSQVGNLAGAITAKLNDDNLVLGAGTEQCQRQADIIVKILRRLKDAVMLT